jgi:hypothetical protein
MEEVRGRRGELESERKYKKNKMKEDEGKEEI